MPMWYSGPYGEGRMGGTRRGTRLTQREAAERLGVSVEAIRKRVKRGTLLSDKGEDGRRYVYLDDAPDDAPDADRGRADEQGTHVAEDRTAELIATLREQLQAERQAHAEARRIIAGLVERIPQLEPPPADNSAPDSSQAPERGEEQQGRADVRPDAPGVQENVQRPWWRRMFGR